MGFADNIAKWNAKALKNTKNTYKRAVVTFGETFIDRWPTGNPSLWKDASYASYARANGYEGGHSKANIQTSHGTAKHTEKTDGGEFPKPVDPTGAGAKRELKNVVYSSNLDTSIFITVTVDYARQIEYFGQSGQAPNGAMRITVDEFDRILERAKK